MRKMKNSGIEWIGEIPESWEIGQIGHLYDERKEKVSDRDYPPLSVTMKGIVPQLSTAAKTDAHDDRKLVKKGDFAINSRSDRRGSCGISAYDGSVSLINTILCPRNEMNPQYYDWLFHTTMFADEFYKWGHGIVDDLWTTNWADMKKIGVPIPDLHEQSLIAAYLDRQCALIDSVTEKTKASIEEYKKLRQAVITQAVTKGVRGDRPMKEVENGFVDHIPNNWTYQKVKNFIAMRVIDGPHESPELYDDGIPYISATAIVDSKIDFSLMRGYISAEYCDECDKRYKPQINDILLIKLGASTGQVAIVDTDRRFNIWVPLAAIRCDDSVVPKFIYYSFQSEYLLRQMELSWTYGTQQTLGVKTIEQLRFVLPIIDEQQEIAAYLDKKCAEIDALITKKETFLAELEAYKKSLIYEVVTGKKEV